MNKLKLNPTFRILLLIILIVFIYTQFQGCDNTNDIITPEDQDITVEAAFSRNTAEVQTICCNVNSYLALIANNVTNIPGSCPVVSVNTSAKTITVDYGSGCTTDSIKRSGSYIVGYFINSLGDSLTAAINFSNYKVYKTQSDLGYVSITGTNIISSKKINANLYQSQFNISNTFASSAGKTKTVSVVMNSNSTITNSLPQSGTFNITGSGTLNNVNTGISYSYVVNPSYAISYQTTCRYPYAGIVYFDTGGNRFTIDFSPNNNNCDGIISVTKFGITKYINLSVIDF